ncbi:hypothetical protein KFL_002010120 [Klebsormidium nitens]|uniref:Uncharacterized protein n=1 Tax=Klebsormidium nitens TaxID=105231 RepID=A0A0U9HP04_KLENI|nr:hypothetical protein KFL_002010120 [Klebsormidium nitens]|eukprot:GAQ84696.1 hypothetical protein KFL_002010120 [Klebsormidium nitens]
MMARSMVRRLALLALCLLADHVVASLLGAEAWPAPVLFTYKALRMLDLQVHQNILYLVYVYLHVRLGALLIVDKPYLFLAPWWQHTASLLLFFFLPLFSSFNENVWRVAVMAAGIVYIRSYSNRTRFLTTWLGLIGYQQIGPLDPALLGTLLLHLCVYHLRKTEPVLMLLAIYVGVSWLVHLFAKGFFSTGTEWGDRLLKHHADTIWSTVTYFRLFFDTAYALMGIFCGWPSTRTWIAKRVEQETRKAAAYQLDCYIRADKTRQPPYFDQNTKDTLDLEVLCARCIPLESEKRTVREFLISAASRGAFISGTRTFIDSETARELLAHLSFVERQDGDSAGRSNLAQEFLRICRHTVAELQVHDLEVGLGGLANLVGGDPVTGSLLRNERLFSILGGVIDPSAVLATSFVKKAAKEMQYIEEHFERSDPGYAEGDLPKKRREVRGPTNSGTQQNSQNRAPPH